MAQALVVQHRAAGVSGQIAHGAPRGFLPRQLLRAATQLDRLGVNVPVTTP